MGKAKRDQTKTQGARRKARKVPGKIVGEANGLPIRRLKISDLIRADYNPREISEAALAGLGASIEEFGLVQPIVWNKATGNVVGGHQRLRTLPDGVEVDVIEVSLTPDKEKALNVTLNSRHISGDWTENLGEILDELDEVDPELVARLHIDELRVDIPALMREPVPPEKFPEEGSGRGKTVHECPACGHEWS